MDSPAFLAFCKHAKAFLVAAEPQDGVRRAGATTTIAVSGRQRDQLNGILNELTGLDYRHEQLLADFVVSGRLFL